MELQLPKEKNIDKVVPTNGYLGADHREAVGLISSQLDVMTHTHTRTC